MQLSSVALLLAILAGTAAAFEELTGPARSLLDAPRFPYCRCVDYSANNSPYSLVLVKQTPFLGGVAVRFVITDNDLPPKPSTVNCRALLRQNLNKIAFHTTAACKGSATNIRINGQAVLPVVRWEDFQGAGSLLKLTSLDLTNAVGANITMRLTGNCASVTSFFGSTIKWTFDESNRHVCCPVGFSTIPEDPPAPEGPSAPPQIPRGSGGIPRRPPPPSGTSSFPFCQCNRAQGGYRLESVGTLTAAGKTTWSFRIRTMPGTTWSLYKIEFWIRNAAKNKIVDLTINNVAKPPSFASYLVKGVTQSTFKITPLRLTPEAANGVIIKFAARTPFVDFLDVFVDESYSMFSGTSNTARCATYRSIADFAP